MVCLRNRKKAAKVAGSHDNRQGFTGHAKESGLQWETTGGLKQMSVRVSSCWQRLWVLSEEGTWRTGESGRPARQLLQLSK